MREQVFAGSFYPADKNETIAFIKNAMKNANVDEKNVENAYSYVSPHAGYIYSGKTAAFTYKALSVNKNIDEIETIVIIGPNHTGFGQPISISLKDWKTPIGIAKNDEKLSNAIVRSSDYISINEDAHAQEHSIEVQLPFLQFATNQKKFVFICMGDQSTNASVLLSDAILKAEEKTKRKITVLASSDFNHYESLSITKKKDTKVLGAIKNLDYLNFNKLIGLLPDSVCGFGPITVAMLFAKKKGAESGILLDYSTSGDQTGDYASVVAYSSIAFI